MEQTKPTGDKTMKTSECGKYTLVGDTYFKHVNARFGHIGDGDTLVYKDCDGNFAELYHDAEGDNIVTLTDLDADDLDLLPDLSFDTISAEAREHLLSLGYNADKLPEQK
jgi:hypothetical protein